LATISLSICMPWSLNAQDHKSIPRRLQNVEGQRCPNVHNAVRRERAAVQFENPFRDRQSETGAAAAVRGGVSAIEAVENEREFFFLDALSRVSDADSQPLVLTNDGDDDSSGGRR